MRLAVGAGRDAAGLLEGLGEMALVEEARLHGDVSGRNRSDLMRPLRGSVPQTFSRLAAQKSGLLGD